MVICLIWNFVQLHRLAQRGAVRAQSLNSSYSTMLLQQSQISNQSSTKDMASFQVSKILASENLLLYIFLIWITYDILFYQGSVWQLYKKMPSVFEAENAFALFLISSVW